MINFLTFLPLSEDRNIFPRLLCRLTRELVKQEYPFYFQQEIPAVAYVSADHLMWGFYKIVMSSVYSDSFLRVVVYSKELKICN